MFRGRHWKSHPSLSQRFSSFLSAARTENLWSIRLLGTPTLAWGLLCRQSWGVTKDRRQMCPLFWSHSCHSSYCKWSILSGLGNTSWPDENWIIMQLFSFSNLPPLPMKFSRLIGNPARLRESNTCNRRLAVAVWYLTKRQSKIECQSQEVHPVSALISQTNSTEKITNQSTYFAVFLHRSMIWLTCTIALASFLIV